MKNAPPIPRLGTHVRISAVVEPQITINGKLWDELSDEEQRNLHQRHCQIGRRWVRRILEQPMYGYFCGVRFKQNGYRKPGYYNAVEGDGDSPHFKIQSIQRVALIAHSTYKAIALADLQDVFVIHS